MPKSHVRDSSRYSLRAFVADGKETEAEAASGNGDLGASADLATLQHGVDFTLGLRLLEATGTAFSAEFGKITTSHSAQSCERIRYAHRDL